jgi:hypothetical protein
MRKQKPSVRPRLDSCLPQQWPPANPAVFDVEKIFISGLMNMALNAGVDPRVAALTVAVAASNTFVLPTHQVNALIMRPGGYRTIDYVRSGAGMTIIYMVVMISALMIFY